MELRGQCVLGKHTLLLSYISSPQRGSSQHRAHGAHDTWLKQLPPWSTAAIRTPLLVLWWAPGPSCSLLPSSSLPPLLPSTPSWNSHRALGLSPCLLEPRWGSGSLCSLLPEGSDGDTWTLLGLLLWMWLVTQGVTGCGL